MIVHNLALKLQDASGENIARTREILLGMQEKIALIRELQVAVDVRRAEKSYDLLLITKFATLDDFHAYLPHPAHVEVGGKLKDLLTASANVVYEE